MLYIFLDWVTASDWHSVNGGRKYTPISPIPHKARAGFWQIEEAGSKGGSEEQRREVLLTKEAI